jgi:hypothetical protein
MRTNKTDYANNSSESITFLADFGMAIPDFNAPEPSMTIVSDFENETVSQNA